MTEFVITATGPDRPGLVDELTGSLLDAGGNIADSRMVNLRGQFALILLVEIDPGKADALRRSVAEASGALEMNIQIAPQSPTPSPPMRDAAPYRLRTYAMDQPGIVHQITHLLHTHGVNIEELQTHLESGSYTSTPVFTMDLRMTVPTAISVHDLRNELQSLCNGLNCDVDLEPS